MTVSELEATVGMKLLPGVPQRVRDAGMTLPVPSGNGDNHAKRRKRGGPVPEVEYTLSDIARRAIDVLLHQLRK